MTRRLLALAAVLLLGATGAFARAPEVTVSETRPFGYFLGDVIEREVTVRVGPGDTLDTASLPRPGPLPRPGALPLHSRRTQHGALRRLSRSRRSPCSRSPAAT